MPALQLDDHIKEEVRMKYQNAQAILPEELVKELQNYVQGTYIYIPEISRKYSDWITRLQCATLYTQYM